MRNYTKAEPPQELRGDVCILHCIQKTCSKSLADLQGLKHSISCCTAGHEVAKETKKNCRCLRSGSKPRHPLDSLMSQCADTTRSKPWPRLAMKSLHRDIGSTLDKLLRQAQGTPRVFHKKNPATRKHPARSPLQRGQCYEHRLQALNPKPFSIR